MPHTSPVMLSYAGVAPDLATPPEFIGPGAALLGRVTLGRNPRLGSDSVIRADGHIVQVGDDLYLGDRSTLHIAHEIYPCILGHRVTIGVNACVHACTVGNDVMVGDDVVILDGAVVEDNVIFEAGATVFPGKKVAGGFLYAGSPAAPVRRLEEGEVAARREEMLRHPHATARTPDRPAAGSALDASVFIARTASVRGRLVAGAGASIWYSNEFDAGTAAIVIGDRTNVQDNTRILSATSQGVTIGPDTTVGHNVTIHDSVIGSGTLIGIGSSVAPGTTIGDRVLLAASAKTTPGQVLESGWLYAGNPAQKRMPLDQGKQAMVGLIVRQYCLYARDFKAEERVTFPEG
jgi:carbonic anhydrase/acetyltransferase-like protein (isoleucine patch superfamily)